MDYNECNFACPQISRTLLGPGRGWSRPRRVTRNGCSMRYGDWSVWNTWQRSSGRRHRHMKHGLMVRKMGSHWVSAKSEPTCAQSHSMQLLLTLFPAPVTSGQVSFPLSAPTVPALKISAIGGIEDVLSNQADNTFHHKTALEMHRSHTYLYKAWHPLSSPNFFLFDSTSICLFPVGQLALDCICQ